MPGIVSFVRIFGRMPKLQSGQAAILDGKAMAARLRKAVARDVERLESDHGVVPGLAVVLVGDDPASQVYVGNKLKQTSRVGIRSFDHRLPATASEAEVLALVKSLNDDREVHGILVQLPLPDHIDASRITGAVHPAKDVDGLHSQNMERLMFGGEGMVPCTPLGCLHMLHEHIEDLTGLHAVVIGRSRLVGKPLAELLLREDCTVTMAHSKTRDLPGVCRTADILVAAIGKPCFVRGDWIKPGAVVIDVGINRIQRDGKAKLVGDVAFDEAVDVAGAITPVPGGVGPMTIACLLSNTVLAAERQLAC